MNSSFFFCWSWTLYLLPLLSFLPPCCSTTLLLLLWLSVSSTTSATSYRTSANHSSHNYLMLCSSIPKIHCKLGPTWWPNMSKSVSSSKGTHSSWDKLQSRILSTLCGTTGTERTSFFLRDVRNPQQTTTTDPIPAPGCTN